MSRYRPWRTERQSPWSVFGCGHFNPYHWQSRPLQNMQPFFRILYLIANPQLRIPCQRPALPSRASMHSSRPGKGNSPIARAATNPRNTSIEICIAIDVLPRTKSTRYAALFDQASTQRLPALNQTFSAGRTTGSRSKKSHRITPQVRKPFPAFQFAFSRKSLATHSSGSATWPG